MILFKGLSTPLTTTGVCFPYNSIAVYKITLFYLVDFYCFPVFAVHLLKYGGELRFGIHLVDEQNSPIAANCWTPPYFYIYFSIQLATCQCTLCVTVLHVDMQGE